MGRKKARFYKDVPKDKIPIDTNSSILDPSIPNRTTTLPTISSNSPPETKLSKKKTKQLEKYIEKKLKKDARPELFSKLQQSSLKQDLTNLMVSTKELLLPKKSKRAEKNAFNLKNDLDDETENENEDTDDDKDSNVGSGSDTGKVMPRRQLSKPVDVIPETSIDLNWAIRNIKGSSLNPLDSSSDEEGEGIDNISPDRPNPPIPSGPSDSDMEDTHLNQQVNLPPHKTFFVTVERSPEIEEQRAKLPIFAEEQIIMETILSNPVTIICGETGSGKTTQVPQFLYEAGFGDPSSDNPGLIGVTQPRRLAAISMSKRVGQELNQNLSGGGNHHVSYQIRYDGTVNRETRIKFMTDGILLRELTDDFLLTKYSVICLDEAHERNLNTDILIGMLSRVIKMRNQLAIQDPRANKPLRLVIMSATLNIDEFLSPRLFYPSPPLIKVDARQHPVTFHFSKKTNDDYIDEAYKIIRKIHSSLPAGGILVFLTGKQEIITLAKRLKSKYGGTGSLGSQHGWREDNQEDWLLSEEEGSNEEMESFDSDPKEEDAEDDEFQIKMETREPLHVLPLYSLLAPEEQEKVFSPPPEGSRLCVLSTNVAETSLTIPNIRYVVDCGRVKQRHYDHATGAQEYQIEWTSKASAIQRAGRAGRVGPGHCYRLYSSAVFEQQFPKFSIPEILRTSIEGLILQLKTMGIDHPEKFPLPTPLDIDRISLAQERLLKMKAISSNGTITKLGRKMASIPLNPIWSRMVIISLEMNNSATLESMALAAIMSVGDPFLEQDGSESSEPGTGAGTDQGSSNKPTRQVMMDFAGKPPTSDLLMWLNVFIKYISEPAKLRRSFCTRFRLMPKRMEEIYSQFQLLLKYAKASYPLLKFTRPLHLTEACSNQLRKLVAESLPDHIAERIKTPNIPGLKKLSFPAYRIHGSSPNDTSRIVYLHPTSVLLHVPPKYICFTELVANGENRFIKFVSSIELAWIPS